jgi:LPPG:FO 2-phospho-L-lactate transferase
MDLRGSPDLFGRALQVSITGHADEIAAAASLVMGQGDEGQPVVVLRGLTWRGPDNGASELVRPPAEDISPDIDTLTYVLAGIDNPATGWGRRDETWSFMDSIGALGGEDWFRLGDRDLALHVERTRRLRLGQTLSEVTTDICRRLGIGTRVVPMSDDRVRTRVRVDAGWIDFQDYFVRQQCRPVVHELVFDGVTLARPNADIAVALRSGDVRAVIVCPSNPFISVEPILAIPGMRDAIKASGAPIVAVSPIISGQAVKGPTAKMMRELGLEASAAAVAARYGDLLDGYIVDHADADVVGNVGARVTIAKTLMKSLHDRETLARVTLGAADALVSQR